MFDWRMFAWSATFLGVWVVLVLTIVPKVAQVFMDFKVRLPVTAQIIFGVEHALRAGFWVLVIFVPVAIGFAAAPLSRGGRRVMRLLLTLAFALLLVIPILSLLVPLVELMNGMSASPGR